MSEFATVVVIGGDEPERVCAALRAEGISAVAVDSQTGVQALIEGLGDPDAAKEKDDWVVLADGDLPDEFGFELHRLLHRGKAVPTLTLVAAENYDQFARDPRRAPLDEFAAKPLRIQELVLRVKALMLRAGFDLPPPPDGEEVTQRREDEPSGTVIVVAGAKGGIGRTTVAVNLADGLVRFHGRKTLLVDADVLFGDVGVLLNVESSKSLSDVCFGGDVDILRLQSALVPIDSGLSVLLRGLKHHTTNITAIVTVADDGGSSGRLRRSLGVLPPGDFRNCIAALADDEALTTQLFQYRFGRDQDLGGHSFGNLFITAMAEVTGSFERALLESSHVLNIRGRVLPSTLRDVKLIGELVEEGEKVSRVEGESQITLAPGAIRQVYLEPEDVPAYPESIRAILDADMIVLGPGSLYTSLMPNLLVRDLAEAVRASRAIKVYVCNTATQPGETDGYSVLDHLAALERHTAPGLFPIVLTNSNQAGQLLPHLRWVRLDPPVNGARRLVAADLADDEYPWRHDSRKLAGAVIRLLDIEDLQGTALPEVSGPAGG